MNSAPPPALDTTVSVIIPTLNGGNELVWLVRKLKAQRGIAAVEVFVVDSGSTDGSPEAAEQLGSRVLPIKPEEFSHSHARNLGARQATGDLILFMVQDAFPVGDFWLHDLAAVLLHPPQDGSKVSALSCAEYARSDSDLFYDSLLVGHQAASGCRGQDRIGQLTSGDNYALREQGQLSDIACMIPRLLFSRYEYHGTYGEDLMLGIRLIQDGHRIALLSSVPVIHSHRRPTSYFLRRNFVDVLFYIQLNPDHPIHTANSVVGSLCAAFEIRRSVLLIQPSDDTPARALQAVIDAVRHLDLPTILRPLDEPDDFGFLRNWTAELNAIAIPEPRPFGYAERRSAKQVQTMISDRLRDLGTFVAGSYPVLDAETARELNDGVDKVIGLVLGAQLAYCYLSPYGTIEDDATDGHVRKLKDILRSGI